MAKRRNAFCRRCMRHRDIAGRISKRGLCGDCADAAYWSNMAQLRAQDGPAFREQQLAAEAGTLLWHMHAIRATRADDT